MSAPSSMPGPIFAVPPELQTLYDMRDEAAHEGDSTQFEVLTGEIQKWIAAIILKSEADKIVWSLKEYSQRADALDSAAKQLSEKADACRKLASELEAATIQQMQKADTRHVSGDTWALKLREASGNQQVEVSNAALLPRHLVRVSATLRGDQWDAIAYALKHHQELTEHAWLTTSMKEPEANKKTIHAELSKRQVICPECNGRPGNIHYTGSTDLNLCPRCKGAGTIPNSIPGAKLLPRGQRLVVE